MSEQTGKAAAKPKKKTLTWRGVKLELPEDPGSDAGYLIINGQAYDAPGQFLGLILGPQQYDRLQTKHRTDGLSMRETIEDVAELLDKILKDVYGIGSGE